MFPTDLARPAVKARRVQNPPPILPYELRIYIYIYIDYKKKKL